MKKRNTGVISRDEVEVLLSRRLQLAVVALTQETASHVARFLLDSKMVTVFTMFYDQDHLDQTKDKK